MMGVEEVLICTSGRCAAPAQPEHTPCCTAHERPMCCEHYCRSHFVGVHPCTPASHAGGVA